ncbi:MAG: hypothetical protein AAF236_10150, partial [Verrucomicrobiota bacterium]
MKLLLLITGILLTVEAAFSAIVVKDTQGREMTVEVLAYTESSRNVKIKRVADGQVFNVKIDVFDTESQTRIAENAPKAHAQLEVDVSVGRRRERLGDSSYMKKQTITAGVKIENESRDIDFEGGKGILFLIARQTSRYANDEEDYGKVMAREEFQFSVNPRDEPFEFEAKPVITTYDSDRDYTNIGGWEYYGYVVVIQDSDRDIHSVSTSIGNLKKDLESTPVLAKSLLGLQADQI